MTAAVGAPAVVRFEPGCQLAAPGIIACGSGGVLVREVAQCEGACGRPDARLVAQYPNSGYMPPTIRCECGDTTQDSWVITPRDDDAAAAREVARRSFGQWWDRALPEGTRPVYDPDLAWLTGVRLPDGTVVDRDANGS